MRYHHRLKSIAAFGAIVGFLAGCQSTTGHRAEVHHFDPLPQASIGAEDLDPIEPRTVAAILVDAEQAFRKANEAQEKGDYEAALRNYNYMLELMIEADLDPAVFYNLRTEFDRILNTTSHQASLYERGRIRQWTEEDFKRFAVQGDIPIPSPLPQRVIDEIEKIQHSYPRNFQRGLDRSFQYLPYIRNEFAKAGLPQDLVWLAMVESQFHPRATSRVGAGGMWQFMRTTGTRYKLRVDSYVDERYNWERATQAAIAYLTDLYNQFGSWDLALAGYNRGENGIERVIAMGGGERNWWRLIEMPQTAPHIPLETKEFYPKFLASVIVSKNPEKYGFTVNPQPPEPFVRVPVRGSYALADLERASGLPEGALENLNPDLVRKVTPPQGEYLVAVPAPANDRFLLALREVPQASASVQLASNTPSSSPAATAPAQRATGGQTVTHVVRRGETLSGIAQRYGSNVQTIMDTNRIRSARNLRAGQRLTIPVRGNAPAATAVASNQTPSGGIHVVKRGETLSAIASRYGVTVANLQAWNGMGNRTQLAVNDKLVVSERRAVAPAPQTGDKVVHVVQAGEYPARIASRYGVRTADLLAWNDLTENSTIRVGEKLTVYTNGGASAPTVQAALAEPAAPAAATQAASVSPSAETITHVVARGESASVIASKYNVPLNDFLAWNNLTRTSVLKVGDKCVIHKGTASNQTAGRVQTASAGRRLVHTVAKGENPWTIARKYNVDLKDLYEWNNWTKAPVLHIGGQVIVHAR